MSEEIVTIELGFVNAYLAKSGTDFVLFDTGLGAQWGKLERGLAAAGCGPENLKLVLITHADMDHAGNARRFQAEWKVPVAVHGGDRTALSTGESPQRRRLGPASPVRSMLMRLLGRAKFLRMSPLEPDVILADGTDLGRWGLQARVIHLPGHTPGSIAVLTAGGALIAGDVFVNRTRPDVSNLIENFEAYRESLDKAKTIAATIKTVYPGHGSSFPGAAITAIEFPPPFTLSLN